MTKQSIQIIYWALVAFFVVIAAFINSVGLVGYHGGSNPFAAFDELYSVGEVYHILNAQGIKSFILSIIAGNGYIYGRFIYICDALLAFIPYHLFGLKGLVFSIRMAHAIYLIIGFHLINRFINTEVGLARLFTLVLFFSFPVTTYFVGMPKPEPMQFLLIGLFFNYRKHTWSWLLLGLALGSKISIAFACIFLVGLLLYQIYKKTLSFKKLLSISAYGLAGLFIALPSIPIGIFNPHFRKGLINIVSTASKPYDDPSITISDWIIKLFDYYYTLPFAISFILVSLILVSAIWTAKMKSNYRVYLIFAYLCIIPIMLFTKRLWGHYLFLGLALMLPFVFHWLLSQHLFKKYKIAIAATILLLFSLNLKPVYDNVRSAIERNSSASYKEGKKTTLDALAYCYRTYPTKSTGIDIKLYYQFEWFIHKDANTPKTVAIDNFTDAQCIITPLTETYPGVEGQYHIVYKSDSYQIWMKKD